MGRGGGWGVRSGGEVRFGVMFVLVVCRNSASSVSLVRLRFLSPKLVAFSSTPTPTP